MPPQINDPLYDALPDQLKKVNDSLYELDMVLTGGNFDITKIWGPAPPRLDNDKIIDYVKTLAVDGGLTTEINKLLKDVPSSSGINSAVEAMFKGLETVIQKINSTAGELNVGDRVEAFNRLNEPHPAVDYDHAGTNENYGYFPAIEGVINAAAGTDVDLDKILKPVKDLAALASGADAVLRLTNFALGSLELLKKTLNK